MLMGTYRQLMGNGFSCICLYIAQELLSGRPNVCGLVFTCLQNTDKKMSFICKFAFIFQMLFRTLGLNNLGLSMFQAGNIRSRILVFQTRLKFDQHQQQKWKLLQKIKCQAQSAFTYFLIKIKIKIKRLHQIKLAGKVYKIIFKVKLQEKKSKMNGTKDGQYFCYSQLNGLLQQQQPQQPISSNTFHPNNRFYPPLPNNPNNRPPLPFSQNFAPLNQFQKKSAVSQSQFQSPPGQQKQRSDGHNFAYKIYQPSSQSFSQPELAPKYSSSSQSQKHSNLYTVQQQYRKPDNPIKSTPSYNHNNPSNNNRLSNSNNFKSNFLIDQQWNNYAKLSQQISKEKQIQFQSNSKPKPFLNTNTNTNTNGDSKHKYKYKQESQYEKQFPLSCTNCQNDFYDFETSELICCILTNNFPKYMSTMIDWPQKNRKLGRLRSRMREHVVLKCSNNNYHLFRQKQQVPMMKQLVKILEQAHLPIHRNEIKMCQKLKQIQDKVDVSCVKIFLYGFLISCSICRNNGVTHKVPKLTKCCQNIYQEIGKMEEIVDGRTYATYIQNVYNTEFCYQKAQKVIKNRFQMGSIKPEFSLSSSPCFYDCSKDSYIEKYYEVQMFLAFKQFPTVPDELDKIESDHKKSAIRILSRYFIVVPCPERKTYHVWRRPCRKSLLPETSSLEERGFQRVPMKNQIQTALKILHQRKGHLTPETFSEILIVSGYYNFMVKKRIREGLELCEECKEYELPINAKKKKSNSKLGKKNNKNGLKNGQIQSMMDTYSKQSDQQKQQEQQLQQQQQNISIFYGSQEEVEMKKSASTTQKYKQKIIQSSRLEEQRIIQQFLAELHQKIEYLKIVKQAQIQAKISKEAQQILISANDEQINASNQGYLFLRELKPVNSYTQWVCLLLFSLDIETGNAKILKIGIFGDENPQNLRLMLSSSFKLSAACNQTMLSIEKQRLMSAQKVITAHQQINFPKILPDQQVPSNIITQFNSVYKKFTEKLKSQMSPLGFLSYCLQFNQILKQASQQVTTIRRESEQISENLQSSNLVQKSIFSQ